VAADAADGETKEQRAAGLPSEVESPTEPEGAGAEVSAGEQQTEGDGDGEAGVGRAVGEGLDDGKVGSKAYCSAHGADCTLKALKSVAAKGNFFSEGDEGEEDDVGQEPKPGGRLKNKDDGDASDDGEWEDADEGDGPTGGEAEAGFTGPSLAKGPTLRADGIRLAIDPESHGRIAKEEKEDEHCLVDQRDPLLTGEVLRTMASE